MFQFGFWTGILVCAAFGAAVLYGAYRLWLWKKAQPSDAGSPPTIGK